MVKTCTKCKLSKSTSEFSPRKGKLPGTVMSRCKACNLQQKRERYAADINYYRRGNVKQKYGITLDEYDALMAAPCAICGEKSQHLDHDHASGKIRSPLCRHCNLMLGHARDTADVLRAAADYLDTHDTLVLKTTKGDG